MNKSSFNALIFTFPLLIGYMVYAMFRLSLGVVLPNIQSTFGIFEFQAGALVSTSLVAIGVAMVLGGYLSDRVGVKVTSLLGLVTLTSGLWFVSFASNFFSIICLFALAGVGGGIINPTVYAWLGEHIPKSRGLMLGFGNSIFFIGGILGPWITGLLLSSYGWDIPFKLFALVGLAAVLIYLPLFRTKYKTKTKRPLKPFTLIQGYKKLLKIRNVLVIYCSMSVVNFAFVTFITWTPTFLLAIQNLNIAETGLAMASFSVVGCVSSIIIGYLSDKFGRKILAFCLGAILAFLTFFLYSSTLNFPMAILFISLCGFLFAPYWNLMLTLTQDTVETTMVGTATGLVQNGAILGSIPSPIIVGAAIDLLNTSSAMIYGVTFPLLIYSILILGYKET